VNFLSFSECHDFSVFCICFLILVDCLDGDIYGVCLHTSLLLQFMEYLERHLYNAVEGCAVTMAPLPKVLLCYYVWMLWLVLMKLAAAGAAFPWLVHCIVTLCHASHFSGTTEVSLWCKFFENFSCYKEQHVIHFWLLMQEFAQTCHAWRHSGCSLCSIFVICDSVMVTVCCRLCAHFSGRIVRHVVNGWLESACSWCW